MTETARLSPSDGQVLLGGSVSINASGNTLVSVSELLTAAYVFTEPGTGWASMTQTARLTASDGYFGGSSAAISGNTVVFGAYSDTVNGNTNQGAAYVFTEPASGWSRTVTEVAKLTASDGAAKMWFGNSVANDGNMIVAGAWHGNVNQGAAYVFGPLALTPTSLALGTENVPYSESIDAQTISALGGTPPVNLTVSNIQGAIPGLSVPNSGTGSLVISGTPTTTGTETFTVTATDSAGNTATANYSLSVQAIALSPATLPADTVSVLYSQAITALGGSNPGGATLSVSNIVGAAAGLNIPAAGTGSLAISGTPASSGTETFTVTATDNAGDTTSANYSITVNLAVALSPATLPSDTVNVACNQTITASGGTGAIYLTVSNIAGKIKGLTVPTSGTGSLTISGTPTATGTGTFTVTATDSVGGTVTANYSIKVTKTASSSLASAAVEATVAQPTPTPATAYLQYEAASQSSQPDTNRSPAMKAIDLVLMEFGV
jgi:hypothetical protein